MKELLWKSSDVWNWQPAVLWKSQSNCRSYSCNKCKNSVNYMSFLSQNIHSTVWDSQSLNICILAAVLAIGWVLTQSWEPMNQLVFLMAKGFIKEVGQRGLSSKMCLKPSVQYPLGSWIWPNLTKKTSSSGRMGNLNWESLIIYNTWNQILL